MSFVTKEWKDRLAEFAGRRKLANVSTGEETTVDVSRAEGEVSQAGDAFSAANMNDLEQRIKDGFDKVDTNLDSLFLNPSVMFDETGWTTPTVVSSRAKDVKGGYKVINGICYVNISFTLNYSQDYDTSSHFFTGMPTFSDNDFFTQFFTVVSGRGNNAFIDPSNKTGLYIGGNVVSNQRVGIKGFYKVAQ